MTDEENNMAKMFTRGGQITFNNIRMFAQVMKSITNWSLVLTVLMTLGVVFIITSPDTIKASYYYILSSFLYRFNNFTHVFEFNWHGQLIKVNTIAILSEPYFFHQKNLFIHNLKEGVLIGFLTAFCLVMTVSIWLIHRGKKQAKKRYIRGTRIDSPHKVAKEIRSKKIGASDIEIEFVPMVKDFEIKHTLIHGTTGSGKGQTFNQFLDQIRKRGDSAIIFDKGCVFTSLFYHEKTDVILNPFDARCANWDLWEEAKTEPDFENIAESLIPMHGESDPYWVDAARTVFSAVAYRMRMEENPNIHRLLSLILTSELDVLSQYLKGTQASSLVSDKIEKTAISIRSVISTYLKCLRFLQGLENRDSFCIRDWIKKISDSKQSHFLFISSNAEQHAALRPLISMWLSMASISLLSLEENFNRRIWFVCDELPTLHKLPQLGETIAEVRKFGGCFILGMQSFSQLQKIYGRSSASEIFDLLNTRFFFRSPSSDMAQLISKELGQEDIEQSNESYSYGANTIRDGISIGTQRVTRPLVSPAEIMELPDLTAYLKVPAPVAITKIKMVYKERKKRVLGFVLRSIPDIKKQDVDDENDGVNAQESAAIVGNENKKKKSEEIVDTSPPPLKKQLDLDVNQKQEENILDVPSAEKLKSVHEIELD